MKKSDGEWIYKWAHEPFIPIVKNYKGVIVGSDEEPDASVCMASFAVAMGDKYREGMKILDYGCGSARFCNFLSKRIQNFTYFGIERNISPYTKLCIDTAVKLFGRDNRITLGYTDTDVEKKAIAECDVVLLLSVFTHTTIEMAEDIVNRLMPLIDRGGFVVFSMIHDKTYRLVGNAYGFKDEYSVTYNTVQQVTDMAEKFNVNITLESEYDAKGIIHSIYRISKKGLVSEEIIETPEIVIPNDTTEKYDYIVCLFFGDRRGYLTKDFLRKDKYYFLRKHVDFLTNTPNVLDSINEVIFLINNSNSTDHKNVVDIVNEKLKSKVRIVPRNNDNYSYGAWNDALISQLNNAPKYAFLCEDDYIPAVADFHKHFINYFTDDVAYVCQLYTKSHAAISNGFIAYDKCKLIYEKHSTVFKLVPPERSGYKYAQEDQVNFLNLFNDYRKLDTSDKYKTNFYNVKNIVTYGNIHGMELLKPILE